MNENLPKQATADSLGPVSCSPDMTAALLAGRQFMPPVRPGLLARLEHYEVLRELGSGGMGVVYLARDTRNAAQVAIKLLKPEFAGRAEAVARFVQEGRMLRQLEHPNLVPVHEVVERAEGPYFVMPFFPAGSLSRLLKGSVPLSGQRSLGVALQVAEALRFIHSKGLIHRDLKPGNILLGDDGRAVLADFGLARTLFNDPVLVSENNAWIGTAPYLSPALAAGEVEDTRCDTYAFGTVLYEMLTGRPPYHGSTLGEIRSRILQEAPVPISRWNPTADARLAAVAEGAMAREHRDRYANMTDVVSDLRRVQSDRTPFGPHRRARQPSIRLRRVRRGAWISATSVGLVALAIGFLVPRHQLEVAQHFFAPEVPTWEGAVPAAWDGSPGKQLLVVENNDLLAFSADGRFLNRWHRAEADTKGLACHMVADLQRDGTEQALVGWTQGRQLRLSVVNGNAFELKRFTAVGHEPDPRNLGHTSLLFPLGVLRADESRDRRRKLVAGLETNFGLRPRGLCCFDYEGTQLLWQALVGPAVQSFAALDLDGDGSKDVICGSSAVDNGNVAPDGSDDRHSYVFAFSNAGRRLWRRPMGGVYSATQVLLANLSSNRPPALLAWVRTHESFDSANRPALSRIVRLDYTGHILKGYQPGVSLRSCLVTDLHGNGSPEVLCSDCNGCVHVLNPDLTLRRKVQVIPSFRRPGSLDRAEVFLVKAGRLRPGTSRQLVAWALQVRQDKFLNPGRYDQPVDRMSYRNMEILVLNADLRPIARYVIAHSADGPFHCQVRVADVDGDGLDEILLLTDRVIILKLR